MSLSDQCADCAFVNSQTVMPISYMPISLKNQRTMPSLRCLVAEILYNVPY